MEHLFEALAKMKEHEEAMLCKLILFHLNPEGISPLQNN